MTELCPKHARQMKTTETDGDACPDCRTAPVPEAPPDLKATRALSQAEWKELHRAALRRHPPPPAARRLYVAPNETAHLI